MKYCRFCGKQISDNAKFCNSCGKDLRASQQHTDAKQKGTKKPAKRQRNLGKIKSPKIEIKNEVLEAVNKAELFDSRLKPQLDRLDDKFRYLAKRNDYLVSDYFALTRQIDETETEMEKPLFSTSTLNERVVEVMGSKIPVQMRILEYLSSEFVYEPLFKERENWYKNKEEHKFLISGNEMIGKKHDLMTIIDSQIGEISHSIKHSKDKNQINISTFYATYVDVRENMQVLEKTLNEIAKLMEKSQYNDMVDDTYQEIQVLVKLLELHSVRHETFSMAELNALVNDISQTVSFEIKQLTDNFHSNEAVLEQLNPSYEQSMSNYLAIMKQVFDKGIYKTLPRKKQSQPMLVVEQPSSNDEIFTKTHDLIHEDLQTLQSLKTLNNLDDLSELAPLK